MEMSAVWIAGIAGLLAVIVRFVVTPSRPDGPVIRASVIGAGLALLGWALTLPASPPFQPGQGLGWGFAIGSLAAVLAMAAVGVLGSSARSTDVLLASAGVLGAWVAGMALALTTLRPVRIDALTGMMLGWLTALIVCSDDGAEASGSSIRARVLLWGSVCAMASGLACLLGTYRGGGLVASYVWTASALAVSAGVCAGCMAAAGMLAALKRERSGLLAGLTVALVVAIAAWLVTTRLKVDPWGVQELNGVFWCSLIGLAAGAIVYALAWADSAHSRYALPLIAIGAALPCYQMLAGMGIGIAGLCMGSVLVVAALIADDETDRRGSAMTWRACGATTILIALAAIRLASVRYGPALRPFAMSEHYALIALLFGVFVPWLTGTFVQQRAGHIYRAVVSAFSMVWPLVMMETWGAKTLYGTIMGLGVSPVCPSGDDQRILRSGWMATMASLLGMAAQLQFAPWALRFSELTRLERARLAGLAGIACVLAILLAEIARRRALRSR